MRILHLSTLYPPHVVGGAERSVELLAEEQVSQGHDVGVACIERQAEPAAVRNGVTVYRMAHSNLFWLEDWPKFSQTARNYQKVKQQWNTAIERQFSKIIKDFRPDIINTHSMVDISTLVWRAARKNNVPVVHTLRDYDLICGNAAMFRHGARCEKWHLGCKIANFSSLPQSRFQGSPLSARRSSRRIWTTASSITSIRPSAGRYGTPPSSAAAMRRRDARSSAQAP
jgi:glycosyltransferase involved in cell wall biosynthesis